MSNIWFTSDHHFGHANVINHSKRPFADLDEMTDNLIQKWNNVVRKGDLIYHLGDFCLTWKSNDSYIADKILSNLNGNKQLIIGNHDRDYVTQNQRWSWVGDYKYIDIGGQKIALFHYPIRSWRGIHQGAWHLHGHCHGNLLDIGGRTMDVGVDCHAYTPINYDDVCLFMKNRVPVYVDHHREKKNEE